jgi:maleylacetate reductase
MTPPFTFSGFPVRIVFGAHALDQVGAEAARLDAHRAFLLSAEWLRSDYERVASQLGEGCVGLFDQSVMHVPVEIVHAALAEAKRVRADCLIAFGGGSTLDLAKAVAYELAVPILAVPTTYGGSEVTPVYGVTVDGVKQTFRDLRLLPKTVIYDPTLTFSLPAGVSAASGINAIAHAAEALYAPDGSPITSLFAEEGVRRLAHALPEALRSPSDLAARSDCLYGASLCGAVLGLITMGLHHKLSHTLGGSFNLPHAEVHSIVLPHVLRYNASVVPDAIAKLARALGVEDAAEGVAELRARLGVPSALRDIGMHESDLDRAAKLATDAPYPNPRPYNTAQVRRLLEEAYRGQLPMTDA